MRFADGAATLLADPRCAFLECGPGATLSTLCAAIRTRAAGAPSPPPCAARRDAGNDHADAAVFLRAAGTLWCAGVPVEWGAWHDGERRRRVPLPAYPFQRRRYWAGPEDGAPARTPALAERAPRPAAARHPRPPLATPFVAPRGETETAVARVWEEMLGVAPMGTDDDFHALGGDSLLAAQLIFRVRACLDVELPVRSLYQAPTVAGLARAGAARGRWRSRGGVDRRRRASTGARGSGGFADAARGGRAGGRVAPPQTAKQPRLSLPRLLRSSSVALRAGVPLRPRRVVNRHAHQLGRMGDAAARLSRGIGSF